MTEKIIRDALMLWTTIDPIGTMALFAAVTASVPDGNRSALAFRAIFYSFIILLCSMVIGQFILAGMGIRLISLQVAGGIILFLFGLQMIFGSTSQMTSGPAEAGHDLAVFPLAVPSIAGPGSIMAVVILTDNEHFSLVQQIITGTILLGVLVITYLLMLLAGPVLRIIGQNGSSILVRVMGILLAALSVELVMEALGAERWLKTPP